MLSEFFQESYRDLVIKTNSNNLQIVKNKVISDIKNELLNSDKSVKTHALMKLLFLHLNDSDITWACMNTLEVISTCGKFGKRIGYIIGQIQFKNNIEKLLLIPNLFLKEVKSGDNACISLSLNFVTAILEKNLANQLLSEFDKILNINNDNIRKRVIITICRSLKIINDEERIQKFILSLAKLLENHKSLSNSVLISIISCIQELSRNYPKQILLIFKPLIEFFKECEVNWITIKIIDIFNVLCERIRKDLLDVSKDLLSQLGNMIKKNISKSVEVQIIKLVILNVNPSKHPEIFEKCEQSLKKLLLISDNNLILLSLKVIKSLVLAKKIVSKTYLQDIQTLLQKYIGNEKLSLNKNNEIINFDKIYIECIEIITLSADVSNYKFICEKILISEKNKDSYNTNNSSNNLNEIKLNCFLSIVNKEEIFINVLDSINETKNISSDGIFIQGKSKGKENLIVNLFFDLLYKCNYIEKELENSVINFVLKLNVSKNKVPLTEKIIEYLKVKNELYVSGNNEIQTNKIQQFPKSDFFEFTDYKENESFTTYTEGMKNIKNYYINKLFIDLLGKNLLVTLNCLLLDSKVNSEMIYLLKNSFDIFYFNLKQSIFVENTLMSIILVFNKVVCYIINEKYIEFESLEIFSFLKNFLLNLMTNIKNSNDSCNDKRKLKEFVQIQNLYLNSKFEFKKNINFVFVIFIYYYDVLLNLSTHIKNDQNTENLNLLRIINLTLEDSEQIKNNNINSNIDIKDVEIVIDNEEFHIEKLTK